MSSVQVEAIGTDSKDIPFQAASLDIWDKKYRLRSKSGEVIGQASVQSGRYEEYRISGYEG